jgi:hypothetical protein
LFFPARTVPAPSILCVVCIDTIRKPGQSLADFVREYVEATVDPVRLLKSKVKDLEERLALAQKTIANLNPSHR